MLAKIIGADRLAAEAEVARELVEAVDCLPLAVKILGSRLLVKRHWSLADLRDRCLNAAGWLDELACGDTSVRLALESATTGLDPVALELLDRLSEFDGEFPSWLAGVVLGQDQATGLRHLEALVDARLLATERPGTGAIRFQLAGLNRRFATDRRNRWAGSDSSAVDRVGSAWLALICRAHLNLTGWSLPLIYATSEELAAPDEPLLDRDTGRWLDQERDNLHAMVRLTAEAGLTELSLDLAMALARLFEARTLPRVPELHREHADSG